MVLLERRAGRPAGVVVPGTDWFCLQRELRVEGPAVRVARAIGRLVGRTWRLGDAGESLVLLVSELTGNAVRHGATGVMVLRLRGSRRRLRVELAENGPGRPRVRRAGASAESGRGMLLVEALTVRWGVQPDPLGKCTWAELALA